jgi:hypothetical protein
MQVLERRELRQGRRLHVSSLGVKTEVRIQFLADQLCSSAFVVISSLSETRLRFMEYWGSWLGLLDHGCRLGVISSRVVAYLADIVHWHKHVSLLHTNTP